MVKKIKKNYLIIGIVVFMVIALFFFFLTKFVFDKDIKLKAEEETGDINILLLGIAGGNHDGAELTDTIMVASVNEKDNTVSLVSIPRDLWVPDLEAKVNTAYAFGEEKNGGGKLLAKTVLEKITGKQIDYVFVIDFSGFVKLVDHLGGIEVDVKRELDDYKYPVAGKENDLCGHAEEELIDFTEQVATGSAREEELFPCRYEHVHFDKGIQKMSGEEALKFVRSRHALGGEGSDFARSQRQQAVIAALRNKALSLGIILNPVKVLGAFNIIRDNIDMSAEVNEFDDFIKLANKMQEAKITSIVIDEGDLSQARFGLLYNPAISAVQRYQWVLIPRVGDGNYSEIIEYIECVENGLTCEISEEGLGSPAQN